MLFYLVVSVLINPSRSELSRCDKFRSHGVRPCNDETLEVVKTHVDSAKDTADETDANGGTKYSFLL